MDNIDDFSIVFGTGVLSEIRRRVDELVCANPKCIRDDKGDICGLVPESERLVPVKYEPSSEIVNIESHFEGAIIADPTNIEMYKDVEHESYVQELYPPIFERYIPATRRDYISNSKNISDIIIDNIGLIPITKTISDSFKNFHTLPWVYLHHIDFGAIPDFDFETLYPRFVPISACYRPRKYIPKNKLRREKQFINAVNSAIEEFQYYWKNNRKSKYYKHAKRVANRMASSFNNRSKSKRKYY